MVWKIAWTIVLDQRRFMSRHPNLEEKEEDLTIMEEPSDGLYEKQKRGRNYGRRQTSLAFAKCIIIIIIIIIIIRPPRWSSD